MMENPWWRRLKGYLAITDALIVAWAVYGVNALEFTDSQHGHILFGGELDAAVASLAVCIVWWLALAVFDSRDPHIVGLGHEEYKRLLDASVYLFGVIAISAYLTDIHGARTYLLFALPVGTFTLVLGRWMWRQWLHAQWRAGIHTARMLVVGGAEHISHLAYQLARVPHAGYRIVASYTPHLAPNATDVSREINVDEIITAARQHGADTIAVTASETIGPEAVRRLGWALEGIGIRLVIAPPLTNITMPRIHTQAVPGLPLLHVDAPRFGGPALLVKRIFDLAGATLLIVVFLPLLLVLACAVWTTSPGPAIYCHQRVGLRGRAFRVYKFRSMVDGAEAQLTQLLNLRNQEIRPLYKIHDDPRVTPVGRILRRWSLDELPQLFNVLRGEMSLVGPRPQVSAEVAQYGAEARRRLLVRPGITGLWQVSGRSNLSWNDAVQLDLHYVENWSLAADLVILWKTARAVLNRTGAY
jgi:exopolysaccharide biosynthesis polyprenyl glycosylphosphotransferase